MRSEQPKGWCPGVYRPMDVEDGLLVRLRPHLSRLTAAQASHICHLADTCGNGLIELTNRGNLQIRGVRHDTHSRLLDGFRDLGLLDRDAETEMRRSIVVDPFWRPGDATETVANALVDRLHDLPVLPAKFGFVIDLGLTPMLQDVSGDIRIEYAGGDLIVRADRAANGRVVTVETCLDATIELSHWFAARKSEERRRMAHVVALEDLPTAWRERSPRPQSEVPQPGPAPCGHLVELPATPFPAHHLADVIAAHDAPALRLTPWRMVVFEEPGHARGDAETPPAGAVASQVS